MGRIEKTVFISYRRTNVPWALAIYQNLTSHGYDVFFDYQSIDSGNFEKVILENIKTRAHFLIILTPSALERCKESGDWLRREIETAMDEKRNIVPLMMESFDFGSPLVKEALTGKLASLNKFNGLRVYSEYFFEAMDKLRDRYINVELDNIALPELNAEAQEITDAQKMAASEAPQVEKEELTAQECFERGYLTDDMEESIRYLTEAIRLDPKLADAYTGRGLAYSILGNNDKALLDFETAISLRRDDAFAFVGRGALRHDKDDLDGAIEDFSEAIQIDPNHMTAYVCRGSSFADKGYMDDAIADLTTAVNIAPTIPWTYYDRALIHENNSDLIGAIADYQKYLELGGGEQEGNQKEVEEKIKKLKSKLAKKKPVKKKAK